VKAGRIGAISRMLTPHLGWCLRCQTTWAFVDGHDTMYSSPVVGELEQVDENTYQVVGGSPGNGCFPLCEACWSELTPETRWPFYERMLAKWEASGPPVSVAVADQIRAAVKDGQ
jgi:hypothetical protein